MKSGVTTRIRKGVYRSDRNSGFITLYKILSNINFENTDMIKIRKYYYYPDNGRIGCGGQINSLAMILLHTKPSFLNEVFKHKILDLSEKCQKSY